jgi:hypothetical protein
VRILAEESITIIISSVLQGDMVGLAIAKLATATVSICKISNKESIKFNGIRLFEYLRLRFHIKVLETVFSLYLDLIKYIIKIIGIPIRPISPKGLRKFI